MEKLAGNEFSPKIYALCGRGLLRSLRMLRHGLFVKEPSMSKLPGVPGTVFNVRDNCSKEGRLDGSHTAGILLCRSWTQYWCC